MKKVGKITRPFRYELNQIPYVYTVEVRNRFKGLDLIGRVPDELWNEVCDIVQETGIKTILIEKKFKRAKWLSGEALQIAVKRREVFRKGRGTRDQMANIHWIMEKAIEFQKNICFLFVDYAKALTVWITINCGKFFKRWECQNTRPDS